MDAWVRDILRCPACRSTLADAEQGLRCENPECALTYRIDDGIPVLLIDEATPAAASDDSGDAPGQAPQSPS